MSVKSGEDHFARDLGLEPRTTPAESPQSNDMAKAFVRTRKRDYVRVSSISLPATPARAAGPLQRHSPA